MTTKKTATKGKSNAALTLRKGALAPGKRATVKTKAGFASCIVLAPDGVGAKGGLSFAVALRVAAGAGKVTFVPRGKETLVIDAAASPSASALQSFLRKVWDKKGGDPPTVIDRTARS
jgi:hypothetical protein